MKLTLARLVCLLAFAGVSAHAADSPVTHYDAALAKKVGADEHGMRKYVLVILKTGPHRVSDGPARQEMFKGHFANIERLSSAGVLVTAGPLDGVDGWRGLFIFAVETIDEAKKLVATDPVIINAAIVAASRIRLARIAVLLFAECTGEPGTRPSHRLSPQRGIWRTAS